MDNTFLTLAVHNEYAKRMEDEHVRQNNRIKMLENKYEYIGELASSVNSLAKSVEQMAKAQENRASVSKS